MAAFKHQQPIYSGTQWAMGGLALLSLGCSPTNLGPTTSVPVSTDGATVTESQTTLVYDNISDEVSFWDPNLVAAAVDLCKQAGDPVGCTDPDAFPTAEELRDRVSIPQFDLNFEVGTDPGDIDASLISLASMDWTCDAQVTDADVAYLLAAFALKFFDNPNLDDPDILVNLANNPSFYNDVPVEIAPGFSPAVPGQQGPGQGAICTPIPTDSCVVTTNRDEGQANLIVGSFREVIATCDQPQITFLESLGGETITLVTSLAPIPRSYEIIGPPGGVTIDAEFLNLQAASGITTLFDQNMIFGNADNDSIQVSGGGDFTFNGPFNLDSDTSQALSLVTPGDVVIDGNITINSTTGRGFSATAGTLAITGDFNTITTTNASAVSISSKIAPEGVTFHTISASRNVALLEGQSFGSVIDLDDTVDEDTGFTGSFNLLGGDLSNTSPSGTTVELRRNVRANFSNVSFSTNGRAGALYIPSENLEQTQEMRLDVQDSDFIGNVMQADPEEGQLTASFTGNSAEAIRNDAFALTTGRQRSFEEAASVDITIRNNVFGYQQSGNSLSIFDLSMASDSRFCLDVESNSLSTTPPAPADYRIDKTNNSTLELEGLASNITNDPDAIEAFILNTRANQQTADITPDALLAGNQRADAVVAPGGCAIIP